jgi:hypothetical protein
MRRGCGDAAAVLFLFPPEIARENVATVSIPSVVAMKREISAQIVSGRGWAKRHLSPLAGELFALVGENFHPGSLNLILNRPLRLHENHAIKFAGGQRMLWPVLLNNVPVWLYRWHDAPLHVVEILSQHHLRGSLGFGDGDRILLSVAGDHVATITLRERMAWELLWRGRKKLYYKSYTYFTRTLAVCRWLGATQGSPKHHPN